MLVTLAPQFEPAVRGTYRLQALVEMALWEFKRAIRSSDFNISLQTTSKNWRKGCQNVLEGAKRKCLKNNFREVLKIALLAKELYIPVFPADLAHSFKGIFQQPIAFQCPSSYERMACLSRGIWIGTALRPWPSFHRYCSNWANAKDELLKVTTLVRKDYKLKINQKLKLGIGAVWLVLGGEKDLPLLSIEQR